MQQLHRADHARTISHLLRVRVAELASKGARAKLLQALQAVHVGEKNQIEQHLSAPNVSVEGVEAG